jgi:hypothetical protein
MRWMLALALLSLAACDPDVPRANVPWDAAIDIDAATPIDAEVPMDAPIDSELAIDADIPDAPIDASLPIDGPVVIPDASTDGGAAACANHADCGAGNCCFNAPTGTCIPGDPQPLPPPFDCQPT